LHDTNIKHKLETRKFILDFFPSLFLFAGQGSPISGKEHVEQEHETPSLQG
jgi:hypothetical protein